MGYYLIKMVYSNEAPEHAISPAQMVEEAKKLKNQALIKLSESIERLTSQADKIIQLIVSPNLEQKRFSSLNETLKSLYEAIKNVTNVIQNQDQFI